MSEPEGEALPELADVIDHLTAEERKEVERILAATDKVVWRPLPGPQSVAYYSEADVIGYGGAAGGGKLQPLDSKVLSPKGWRLMGDLMVGDTVTDPTTGGTSVVIGVFPHGEMDIYRVETDDGAVCEVGLEHLWAYRKSGSDGRRPRTKQSSQRAFAEDALGASPANKSRWETLTVGDTAELMRILDMGQSVRIPLTEPVAFTANGRTGTGIVDPYLIGLYLGDGSFSGMKITSADKEIADYLLGLGYTACAKHEGNAATDYLPTGDVQRAFRYWLHDNDLNTCRAWEKRIPGYIQTAGIEYRLAVLQGLMDTDGYIDERGRCYYSTTSPALAAGVMDLARGLGGKARLKSKGNPGYTYKGEKKYGREAYDVRIWMRKQSALFRLSRKKARATDSWNGGHELSREIVSIKHIGRKPARCIKVSSPYGLYVTDGHIVTHNTDWVCGLALTSHEKALILRRESTQLTGLIDRLTDLVTNRDGYNGQDKIWRRPDLGWQIEFGSVPNPNDWEKYKGRPHDLLAIDEATECLELQVRALMTWVRTTNPNQKCRTVMTFNPPTNAEGRWVIDFFAPWLDPKHPNRALPGELRWFASIDGKETEVPNGEPFMHGEELITPKSRTFVPARVADNPHLMATGYVSQLQLLPEPLRSQMLYGDFTAGMEDDPFQVIPTAWITTATERWRRPDRLPPMDAMGIDVARGGKDFTDIARRHGWWFDEPVSYPGKETPDGHAVAGYAVASVRDNAPIHIDVIGVGASPYDILNMTHHTLGINMSEKIEKTDKSGKLSFLNTRSWLWWNFRELLDPANNTGIALPPDKKLISDLTAPRWKLQGSVIKVESRDEIIARIKRSPDRATAYILAAMETPKNASFGAWDASPQRALTYDPYEFISAGCSRSADPTAYNPYDTNVLRSR